MCAGKIRRMVGRAAIVNVLAAGALLVTSTAANADYSWTVGPTDGNASTTETAITQTVDAGQQ